jgi:hypothetical protein
MATYKEIQNYIRGKYNYSIKSCWIAHAKELFGLPVRNAPNRISKDSRTNPCPKEKESIIKEAFKNFGMIND